MRNVLFLIAVFALAVAAPVSAANVSGTWALTQAGPQGDESFDLVIKDNGGSLEITGTHEMLGDLAGTGTVSGSDIAMTVKASAPIAVDLVFQGKVAGNKMEGSREIKMDAAPGGGGGAPSGGQGGAPEGGQGGAPAGGGDQGGAPPADGGQGGAPAGGQGGAPDQGSAPADDANGDLSGLANAWSAVKK
jgi:hypothetical protein